MTNEPQKIHPTLAALPVKCQFCGGPPYSLMEDSIGRCYEHRDQYPSNGVTKMPIWAQQREADMMLESIAELEMKLGLLRSGHRKRLFWIRWKKDGKPPAPNEML
jgi:hypothetical protein